MMAVGGVTGTGSSSGTGGLSGNTGLADNFDTFLSILTTQLKNQNPLDPLDTNAFTQQLVQFSGVEQQLKTNTYLAALLDASTVSQNSSATAMNLIGKEVTVNSAASELKDGSAKWMFKTSAKSDAATITVKDPTGNVVYTTTKGVTLGENNFTWDGKLADGTAAPEGSYTLSVTGNDVAGAPITATTQMSGKVTGVDLGGSQPYLIVGSARIAVGTVLSVRAAN
jgi:flagellar basal-body rod modification protein FlgD